MVKKRTIIAAGLIVVVTVVALSRRAVAAEELHHEDILLDLIVSPATVEVYEVVKVSVTITNISDKTGGYILTLGGDFMVEKRVTLAPGESKTVTFEVAGEAPGRYNVQVDGQFGSFNVVEPAEADIRLSNLVITPSEVEVGETVRISVTATNHGDVAGSRTINCEVT